jgi:hypothetical protein
VITIYVSGYPKSGTTYFTRLLGDALWCPTGGSLPREDDREIATEGQDRLSDKIVRKGHFKLLDIPTTNPVTRPHQLHWRAITPDGHRVIFVIRDPRDIAVSASFYWRVPLKSTIQNMVFGTNSFRALGPWTEYVQDWLDTMHKFNGILVHYEDMLQGHLKLVGLLDKLRFYQLDMQHVKEAYKRQSFKSRVADIAGDNGTSYNLGQEFNLRFMRKGIAGDWKNHFGRQEAFEAEAHFGELLRYFNYESDSLWWKELEK